MVTVTPLAVICTQCFRALKWVSTTDAGRVWEQYVPKEESGMGRDEQRDERHLGVGKGGGYSNF